jgi:dTDP-4-amino-4,6-dideoxygalactose transaminase
MSDPAFIPFNRPLIGDAEIEEVVRVVKSGWLTTGPATERFERLVLEYVHARHALAVNSATAGLHLALAALGIGPGDEVITTPLTFCATVNSILHVGATPVLADIDETLNLDPRRVEAAMTPQTRAIIPVHFAGLPCDMDRLWLMAKSRGVAVVEDAAHAVGSSWKGTPIGSGSSEAVVFSFYATKNMTTGEGGMVTTYSPELYDRMKVLCLHGMSRDAWARYTGQGSWAYDVVECGFKYNMSDLAAALGLAQLPRLDAMIARRRKIAHAYASAFAGTPELELPPRMEVEGNCWHLFVLRLNLELLAIDRSRFIEELGRRGIGCSVHFIPIPLHSYYHRALTLRDPCSRALEVYPRLLSLPLYPTLTEEEVARVTGAVLDVVCGNRRRRPIAVVAPESHDDVETFA